MQCATHPDTETLLRCSKCEKPICPRCVIQTPIGGRCKECARVQPLPQYRVSPRYLARAIGASLGVGLGAGIGLGLSFGLGLVPFLLWWVLVPVGLAGAGFLVGRGVSAATNRKQGPVLQGIAAGGFLVAAITFTLLSGASLFGFYSLIGGLVGLVLAVQPFR